MTRSGARTTSAAWLGLALAMGGCDTVLVNPQVPPPGGGPGFEEGYVDGCRSGFQDAGRDGFQQSGRQDRARYLIEADYKAGYDVGYLACFEEEKRHPKILGGGGHSIK